MISPLSESLLYSVIVLRLNDAGTFGCRALAFFSYARKLLVKSLCCSWGALSEDISIGCYGRSGAPKTPPILTSVGFGAAFKRSTFFLFIS
jgi:hypothetical protein